MIRKLLQSSLVFTGARYAGSLAGFATQLVLARVLPPEGLGIYFTMTSLAAVAGLVATQGFPSLYQRFYSRYWSAGRAPWFRAFVTVSEKSTVLACIVVLPAVASFVLWYNWSHGFATAATAYTLLAVTLSTIASAMFTISQPLATAARQFVLGILPENLWRPIALLIAVAVVSFILGFSSTTFVLMAHGILSLVIAGIQIAVVRRPYTRVEAPQMPRLARAWVSEARPLLLTAILNQMFADVAILFTSFFLDPASVGPFGIALKLALLAGFAVQVGQQTALPDIAEALRVDDVARLKTGVRTASLMPVIILAAIVAAFIFMAPYIMGLFGPHYGDYASILSILTISQLLRAAIGPAAQMLTLKGSQLANASTSAITCLLLLAGNAVLTPLFGINGAAIAAVAAIFAWSAIAAFVLWRKHGVRCDLLFGIKS